MALDIIREDKEGYTLFTVTGSPSALQIIEWSEAYAHSRINRKTIWDFSHSSVTNIDPSAFTAVAESLRGTPKEFDIMHFALVFKSEYDQLIGSAFEAIALALDIPIEYQVFGTLPEAVEWIMSE